MNTGLVFGIIFAIIVIALLLAFGIEQIVNIFCMSNIAGADKSVKDLELAVEDVYNLAQGSAMPFKVSLSRNARICLINPDDPSPMNSWRPDANDYQNWMKDMISDKDYNVWIQYGCGNSDDGYKIRYLRVTENFCVTGGTELYLENMGYHVEIDRPVGS